MRCLGARPNNRTELGAARHPWGPPGLQGSRKWGAGAHPEGQGIHKGLGSGQHPGGIGRMGKGNREEVERHTAGGGRWVNHTSHSKGTACGAQASAWQVAEPLARLMKSVSHQLETGSLQS